jgi:peptide deformylase
MFKWVDNDACTLYVQVVLGIPNVYGSVRTFNKQTYKDTKEKWIELMVALREEGYVSVCSQIEKQHSHMILFVEKLGFYLCSENDHSVLMMKEL